MEILIVPILFIVIFIFLSRSKREIAQHELERSLSDMFADCFEPIDIQIHKDTTSVRPTVNLFNCTDCTYISKEAKQAYLKSHKWKLKRQLILTRDNYQCVSCGSTTQLECHHLDYSSLTNEPLEHLVTLCRTCHQRQHNHYGYDRATDYSIIV